MTQVKLWQIVSQTPNAIVFSDADGNLKTLPAGAPGQILIAGYDGAPMWAANTALATALEAKTDATDALATAKAYTEAQIAALVDNAPVALNTLNELAQKLNGEDSAINALLLQVDGKAEKTEVATAIAQAKQDAIQTAQQHTDTAVGSALNDVSLQISIATGDVLSQAQQDAATKAANAQTAAVATANSHTDVAISSALLAAANDAQQKADAAEANAINAAATDASAKVAALQDAIPGSFWVEGTSTACYVASSTAFEKIQAMQQGLSLSSFAEVTSAGVAATDLSQRPKLLFVNGVAMSDEWTAESIAGAPLVIKFSQRLADHVFDGTENSLMVLTEYRSYQSIALRA